MLLKLWHKVFKPRHFHNRANGPVVINPDSNSIIHVFGKAN